MLQHLSNILPAICHHFPASQQVETIFPPFSHHFPSSPEFSQHFPSSRKKSPHFGILARPESPVFHSTGTFDAPIAAFFDELEAWQRQALELLDPTKVQQELRLTREKLEEIRRKNTGDFMALNIHRIPGEAGDFRSFTKSLFIVLLFLMGFHSCFNGFRRNFHVMFFGCFFKFFMELRTWI